MAGRRSPRRRGQAIENLNYYHIFGGASNEPIIRLADRVLTLFREKAGARHLAQACSSAARARTPTTPTSSWSATTTTCAAGRRRRRSSRALGGYHGLTVAAGSLTGIPVYHKAFDLPIGGHPAHQLPALLPLRRSRARARPRSATGMIAEIEAIIEREGADTIAAFIAEPIMGTGGVLLPPAGYFERVQTILRAARHPAHRRRGDHRLRPHRRSGSRPASTISSPTS